MAHASKTKQNLLQMWSKEPEKLALLGHLNNWEIALDNRLSHENEFTLLVWKWEMIKDLLTAFNHRPS